MARDTRASVSRKPLVFQQPARPEFNDEFFLVFIKGDRSCPVDVALAVDADFRAGVSFFIKICDIGSSEQGFEAMRISTAMIRTDTNSSAKAKPSVAEGSAVLDRNRLAAIAGNLIFT